MRWTLLWTIAAACTPATPPNTPVETPTEAASEAPPAFDHGASDGVENAELKALLDDHWADTMRRNPVWASWLGDDRYARSLPRADVLAQQAALEQRAKFLERAVDLNPDTLSKSDRTTLELFRRELTAETGREVCQFDSWSVSPRSNALGMLNQLGSIAPLSTPEEVDALATRYAAFPGWVDVRIERLREGSERGYVANKQSLELVVKMVRDELKRPVAERGAIQGIEFSSDLPDAEAARERLETLVDGPIAAALARYADMIDNTLVPKGREGEHVGVGGIPHGGVCYRNLVLEYTSLNVFPEDVHNNGLEAIEKVHEEFKVIGERALGTSDLSEIFERLRTDPALRFETSEQVQAKAEEVLAAANEATPDYFGRLPETTCTVQPVPDYEAPYTTIAYYRQPAADGSRPGTYFINTYAPETRPRFEAAVLAVHESVPGHHLQIAIATELPDLPAFRRHAGQTVFVEGWGLYSERLADEMGLYADDLDRLGMLSFDAWRAGRLVVDTGIHHHGWTREKAEQWFRDNTPLAENNIVNEVDRYITTPGQAVAYKTGQQHILMLRAQAEKTLGDDFDIKGFHDAVLGGGAVPLPLLTKQVDAWMGEVLAARGAGSEGAEEGAEPE